MIRQGWMVAPVVGLMLVGSAGCGAGAEKVDPAAEAPSVQVGQENILTVKRDRIVTGPLISGELRAADEATVRAELGGSMVQRILPEQPGRCVSGLM